MCAAGRILAVPEMPAKWPSAILFETSTVCCDGLSVEGSEIAPRRQLQDRLLAIRTQETPTMAAKLAALWQVRAARHMLVQQRPFVTRYSSIDRWLSMPHHALRLAAFHPRSRANGPGVRAVVWVQGCGRGCPGCCNPQFQDRAGGEQVTVSDLLQRIAAAGAIDGITLSGGEPFDQPEPLAELCRRAHVLDLTAVCFSGYTLQELRDGADAAQLALLAQVDLLVAGPFLSDQPSSEPLLASANQRLHFLTDRIPRESLRGVPRAEVIIRDGEVIVSGFDTAVSEGLRDLPDKEVG